MTSDRDRLARLLGGDALGVLRARLRRRYGRSSAGSILTPSQLTLSRLEPHERRAIEGLLGRRSRQGGSLRVTLAELDDAVARAGLAQSFRHALELIDGPIPDVVAERAERERAWHASFSQEHHVRISGFLERASARGLVKRLAAGKPELALKMLASASQVLARLPADGVPRSRLAAEALGDAHALDQGRPVATLVLAVLRGEEEERDRDTWARSGVLVNELAAPVLLLNLPAVMDTPAGRLAQTACDLGTPLHLSLRMLLRPTPTWRVRGCDVFVCENPNVVAIAADRYGVDCAPLVCTDGMPSASQIVLLQQLHEQGAMLRYHGDFDWPGLRIANFVIRTFGARPWRMSADNYAPAGHGKALEGPSVAACWDAELAPRMAASGIAVDEEAIADALVGDLACAG